MGWFPLDLASDEPTWSFDIVGLLAVVGGSSIEKHAQAITASPLGGFPRLLPAPETMLNTDRPVRLPSVKDVHVVGVFSGNHFTELNFFADVIHRVDSLEPYEFQSYEITYSGSSPEQNGPPDDKNSIPLRKICPLNLVTLVSILMTIALFVWAGVNHDAVALIGLGTMTLSTSTACLSSQWRPKLSVRKSKAAKVPPGDVVIRTRSGAFIVVKCNEDIARELYGGTEACDYVFRGRAHQVLLALSTVLLMASIIFFSNCGWKSQIAVGLAYVILNIAYWAMALLTEPRQTWDIDSRYSIKPIERKLTDNYTQVLWHCIRTTGKVHWIHKGQLAPSTPNWDGWLKEARRNSGREDWNPDEARDRWMAMKLEPEADDSE
ncbi:uncharacterized protein BDW47DRAFT_109533 [Aspergillus candidus]|uniref:Uncharacterized protein n=1 Tax=Aspergillus candidus TaxID=41067 RepID=A0A2I2F5Q2_ASPCN|nr:hypothetical protein BDW47DRAFT_109533 [Aspergillus candidus]PLB35964.1 hypothetical protein BDW47DRAFT_109533 [Aspergillus candidus]